MYAILKKNKHSEVQIMPICYDLQGKLCYRPYEGRFETMTEACAHLKKLIRENCKVDSELRAIVQKGLPAPKYRASVFKYLYILFNTGKYPTSDMIDYSDYQGTRRCFPTKTDEEDSECVTGYEKALNFVELYSNENVSSYDRSLGFIFSVGKNGFHLEFLESRNDLRTICYFYRQEELAVFGYEPMEKDRPGFDARIFRTEGELPTKLSGSFYSAMLLAILLGETQPRPITLTEEQIRRFGDDDPNACLMWKLNFEIYAKMNEDFVLPAEIKLSDRTIERYIDAMKELGYKVEQNENGYYIPPFICRRDAELIIHCVKNSNLSEDKKSELIQKFETESGYYRYAENYLEESATPMPFHRKDDEAWKAGYYSLIILNMLRLCDRPMLGTSAKKENLTALIEKHYGVEIGRKAIPNNIRAMMAMGLPIKKEEVGYAYDTSNTLNKADLYTLKNCIAESDILENNTKENLIKKIEEKFPRGAY